MLYEDDVVRAVMGHLQAEGWSIESSAFAHEHGDDVVAVRGSERLIVEAKGEGSSKDGTARFGQTFTRNQVGTHVSVAIIRAMRVVSAGEATAGIAFPANEHHRSFVARVAPALRRLSIRTFWVADDHAVTVEE